MRLQNEIFHCWNLFSMLLNRYYRAYHGLEMMCLQYEDVPSNLLIQTYRLSLFKLATVNSSLFGLYSQYLQGNFIRIFSRSRSLFFCHFLAQEKEYKGTFCKLSLSISFRMSSRMKTKIDTNKIIKKCLDLWNRKLAESRMEATFVFKR